LDAIARARGGGGGDAGGAGDRVMNQLLTEMDGINPTKQIFFIGATNRPDIIDPALKRPGRLDTMIFIDLPDFAARVSILKASLRKSPVDPQVDYEYVAEQTHGYSGADLAGIAQVAAKVAIRMQIEKEVKILKEKEAARAKAEALGEEYKSDAEELEDSVPLITMQMLMMAMKDSKRSVDPENYQRYLDMREQFEKSKTVIDSAISGMNASQSNQMSMEPSATTAPVLQPSLDDDDDDDEDIYA
jgi:transitional endoplasmic reticulum ATPase